MESTGEQTATSTRSPLLQLLQGTLAKEVDLKALEAILMRRLLGESNLRYTPDVGFEIGIKQDYGRLWFPCATPAQLERLVFLETCAGPGAASWQGRFAAKNTGYPWWVAQCLHYGLSFPLTSADAQYKIRTAILASTLTKSAKLRSLENDLSKNYYQSNQRLPPQHSRSSLLNGKIQVQSGYCIPNFGTQEEEDVKDARDKSGVQDLDGDVTRACRLSSVARGKQREYTPALEAWGDTSVGMDDYSAEWEIAKVPHTKPGRSAAAISAAWKSSPTFLEQGQEGARMKVAEESSQSIESPVQIIACRKLSVQESTIGRPKLQRDQSAGTLHVSNATSATARISDAQHGVSSSNKQSAKAKNSISKHSKKALPPNHPGGEDAQAPKKKRTKRKKKSKIPRGDQKSAPQKSSHDDEVETGHGTNAGTADKGAEHRIPEPNTTATSSKKCQIPVQAVRSRRIDAELRNVPTKQENITSVLSALLPSLKKTKVLVARRGAQMPTRTSPQRSTLPCTRLPSSDQTASTSQPWTDPYLDFGMNAHAEMNRRFPPTPEIGNVYSVAMREDTQRQAGQQQNQQGCNQTAPADGDMNNIQPKQAPESQDLPPWTLSGRAAATGSTADPLQRSFRAPPTGPKSAIPVSRVPGTVTASTVRQSDRRNHATNTSAATPGRRNRKRPHAAVYSGNESVAGYTASPNKRQCSAQTNVLKTGKGANHANALENIIYVPNYWENSRPHYPRLEHVMNRDGSLKRPPFSTSMSRIPTLRNQIGDPIGRQPDNHGRQSGRWGLNKAQSNRGSRRGNPNFRTTTAGRR